MLNQLPKFQSTWLILVVALIVRILAGCYWESRLNEGQRFKFGDSDGYWHLATTIVEGEPYQYGSEYVKIFRTPGYPAFLSSLFWLGLTNVLSIRLVGAVLGALSVFLVCKIAERLFDQQTALAAGWIACFYPGAIAISILILAEMVFVPLMLSQLLLLILSWQSKETKGFVFYSMLSGVCFGLACLTRPSWILFVPFGMGLCLVFYQYRIRQLLVLGITLCMLCIVMTPWWIRNYKVSGRFVPTSLQTGPSLYDGLNPDADGSSNMQAIPGIQLPMLQQWKQDGKPNKDFEFAFNEHMKDRALKWATNHPGQVIKLALIKFKRIWMPMPNSQELGSFALRLAIGIFLLPLLIFGIWGAIRNCHNRMVFLVCCCPAIYFTLLHMIFVGSIRYRQPPMMTMLILAAAMLADWYRNKPRSA